MFENTFPSAEQTLVIRLDNGLVGRNSLLSAATSDSQD